MRRAKVTWELAHPQLHDLGDIVAALRRWHGFPPRPRLDADASRRASSRCLPSGPGMLGWRSPARATALAQLSAGVVGDPSPGRARPASRRKSLDAILAERPASVQDRWFARLYWLKPVAIVGAGRCSGSRPASLRSAPAAPRGWRYLTKAGLGAGAAEFALVAGALFDIALGLAVLVRRFTRRALQLMLVVSAGYLAGRERFSAPESGPIRSGPTPRSFRCCWRPRSPSRSSTSDDRESAAAQADPRPLRRRCCSAPVSASHISC